MKYELMANDDGLWLYVQLLNEDGSMRLAAQQRIDTDSPGFISAIFREVWQKLRENTEVNDAHS